MRERSGETGEAGIQVAQPEELHRAAESAGGIATFQFDPISGDWRWSPQAAPLFGLAADERALAGWQNCVFPDDLLKVRAALEAAKESGAFYAEFRVRHPDKSIHWLAAKGQLVRRGPSDHLLCGGLYDISDRKALEARLLALNETLEARVAEVRE